MRTLHPLTTFATILAAWLTPFAAHAAPPSSEASITVTGGPHAGTHALKVDDVGCELRTRPNRPKYFNSNFGQQGLKDPKKLGFVLVTIRNADAAGGPSPADFEAAVTFGPLMDKSSTTYMSGSNPTSGRQGGPGRLLLKDDGNVAQVTLDLQPREGVSIKGTLTCTLVKPGA